MAPEAIIGTGAVTTGSTLILGKTEDSVRKLSRQLVNASDELYKTKTFNTQPVADFIKGETAAGANLSTKTADYLRTCRRLTLTSWSRCLTRNRTKVSWTCLVSSLSRFWAKVEATNPGRPRFCDWKIVKTRNHRLCPIAGWNDAIRRDKTPKAWFTLQKDGMVINLRDFSKSEDSTKARWTIEIIKMNNSIIYRKS